MPYVIQLTDEAYRIWKDWQHEIEPMLGEDGRLCDPALKAWGGKLAGNTARLAGLLHIASTPPEMRPNDIRVSKLIMHRAVSAARVLIDHSIAVHDLASTDGARYKAKLVFEYLERREIEQISVRELQQSLKQRSAFQRSDDVREAVSVLLELGWLFPVEPDRTVGRPSEKYHVHPSIHPQNPQ